MRTLYADFSCFYIYHFILRNLKTEKQRITKNLRFLKIFFDQKEFFLATRLQAECSPTTCPQMTATDQWIFLCAAHKSPKECSAIAYTR